MKYVKIMLTLLVAGMCANVDASQRRDQAKASQAAAEERQRALDTERKRRTQVLTTNKITEQEIKTLGYRGRAEFINPEETGALVFDNNIKTILQKRVPAAPQPTAATTATNQQRTAPKPVASGTTSIAPAPQQQRPIPSAKATPITTAAAPRKAASSQATSPDDQLAQARAKLQKDFQAQQPQRDKERQLQADLELAARLEAEEKAAEANALIAAEQQELLIVKIIKDVFLKHVKEQTCPFIQKSKKIENVIKALNMLIDLINQFGKDLKFDSGILQQPIRECKTQDLKDFLATFRVEMEVVTEAINHNADLKIDFSRPEGQQHMAALRKTMDRLTTALGMRQAEINLRMDIDGDEELARAEQEKLTPRLSLEDDERLARELAAQEQQRRSRAPQTTTERPATSPEQDDEDPVFSEQAPQPREIVPTTPAPAPRSPVHYEDEDLMPPSDEFFDTQARFLGFDSLADFARTMRVSKDDARRMLLQQ